MKETVAIIWLWITAGGLTLIGGLLFYMLLSRQTLHNGLERQANMRTTAAMVAIGGALIVLLLAG